jgi:hypothetical protein
MTGFDYTPDGPVLREFFHADAFARFLIGPFGSGKSVACCVEVFRRAVQQKPGPDKVRRTRWLVVRSTYPQLKTTTIPTWKQWFTPEFGAFSWGPPPTHRMILPVSDGTVVDLEVVFIALDGPDAEASLKGFEGTGIWFNEVREIPKAVVDFGRGRVGRYPAIKDGGPTWYGIVGDTNPPDVDHWLYHFAEEDTPEGFAFFRQPGGLVKVDGQWFENPDAANLKNLPEHYYRNQAAGQSEDFIRVYLGGEYGFALDGKPVYPEFHDSTHTAPAPIAPDENWPLFIGVDFGLTPAALIAQRTPAGQWRWIAELVGQDMGIVRFSEHLNRLLAEWFAGYHIDGAWGDPAGRQRSQVDERAALSVLRQHTSINFRAAPSNDYGLRREAVAAVLNRLVDGQPGLLVSPACKTARKGMAGGYCYRRVQVAGDARYVDKPDKNIYSHVCEAAQYMMLGAGEGRALLGRGKRGAHSPERTEPQPESRVGY